MKSTRDRDNRPIRLLTKSEVERLSGSCQKLKKLTNWTPQYTLPTGLRETIAWFRVPEHLRFYKPDLYNV